MTEPSSFISQSTYGRLWHIAAGEDAGQTVWLCGARTAHVSPARTLLHPTDILEGLKVGRLCAACKRRHNTRAEALQKRAGSMAAQLPFLVDLAVREAFGDDRLPLGTSAEERAFAAADLARELGCEELIQRALADDPSEVLR